MKNPLSFVPFTPRQQLLPLLQTIADNPSIQSPAHSLLGEPPFTWEASAVDALKLKLNDLRKEGDYLDFGELEQWLYFLEVPIIVEMIEQGIIETNFEGLKK